MRIVRFGMSLSMAVVSCGVSTCYSQSIYTLQPLPPARPESVPLTQTPAVPTTEITLTRLQSPARVDQPIQSPSNQIRIEPMQRAKDNSESPSLSVDALIRSSPDPTTVFSKLQVDREFLSSSGPEGGVRGNDLQAGEWGTSQWGGFSYCWESPSFCHSPLYFEQPNLERYGSRNPSLLTPFLSAGHFYGSMILLPAKVVQKPWWDCSCTLGHRRPGNCNPLQRQVSFEKRAYLVSEHTGTVAPGNPHSLESMQASEANLGELASVPMVMPEEELGLEDVHVLASAALPAGFASPSTSQASMVPSPATNLAIPAVAAAPAPITAGSTAKPAAANGVAPKSQGPVVLRITGK